MLEPQLCRTCPRCASRTVLAMRTLNMANGCHCTSCGHVWHEDPRRVRNAGKEEPVSLRPKPDRRRRQSIH